MDKHEWTTFERELRDNFAMHAMHAMVVALTKDEVFSETEIARMSYSQAEAMLIERKRIRREEYGQ